MDQKFFHPILLSSFMLTAPEKLGFRYVGDMAPKTHTHTQHAYMPGTSCKSALHHQVSGIERTLQCNKVALGAFLDIYGAFDNTETQAVINADRAHEFHEMI